MNRIHNTAGKAALGVVLSAATVATTVAAAPPALAARAPVGDLPRALPQVLPSALGVEKPMIIAHRGDRLHAPENTVSAFDSAIDKGADAIELDVQFSRTGYPVVFHDLGLRRTSDCTGRVTSKTVKQLHKCDAGSWFGPAFKGEEIPTLWEALKQIRKKSSTVQVILHMKVEPTKRQARKTMQRVRLNHMSDRTIVMGSTTKTMSRMKQAGAKKRAWIFSSKAGWDHKYKIMVPYEIAFDPADIAAARERGAVVWAVESHPLKVPAVLGLRTPVQGIMLNNLKPSVVDTLDGILGTVVTPLFTANSLTEPIDVSPVGSAEDEMTRPAG